MTQAQPHPIHHARSVLRAELPLIQRICNDEKWLVSEQRGYEVSKDDPEVLNRVCSIISCIGADIRSQAEQSLGQGPRGI